MISKLAISLSILLADVKSIICDVAACYRLSGERTARISIADTLCPPYIKFRNAIRGCENGASLARLNEHKKGFLLVHARTDP